MWSMEPTCGDMEPTYGDMWRCGAHMWKYVEVWNPHLDADEVVEELEIDVLGTGLNGKCDIPLTFE